MSDASSILNYPSPLCLQSTEAGTLAALYVVNLLSPRTTDPVCFFNRCVIICTLHCVLWGLWSWRKQIQACVELAFWPCWSLFWFSFSEVKGSSPVQAWIFFRLSLRNCISFVHNCDDHPSFNTRVHVGDKTNLNRLSASSVKTRNWLCGLVPHKNRSRSSWS